MLRSKTLRGGKKTSRNLSVIFGPDVNLADYYIFENIIQNIVVGVRWLVELVICDIFTKTNIPVDWHYFCSGECCTNKDKAKLSSVQNIGYV